jgi:hypothetical protein
MRPSRGLTYEAPAVLVSYSTADLVAEAASCLPYPSDEMLKVDVRTIGKPLGGVSDIGTHH